MLHARRTCSCECPRDSTTCQKHGRLDSNEINGVATALFTWIDGIQHAPEQIYEISQSVKLFEQALLDL